MLSTVEGTVERPSVAIFLQFSFRFRCDGIFLFVVFSESKNTPRKTRVELAGTTCI